MSKRVNISSGAMWEDIVGYSRAVKIGNIIKVAGTTAVDQQSSIQHPYNAYEQTRFIIQKIANALAQLNAGLADVVCTRMYVCNIDDWEGIAKAHKEFFNHIRPTATMVEVSRLALPELVVEIEVEAIIKN